MGPVSIEAASRLHPGSGAWAIFMREIVGLPQEMTPVVFQVIQLEGWRSASDPVEAVRSEAVQIHRRAWKSK